VHTAKEMEVSNIKLEERLSDGSATDWSLNVLETVLGENAAALERASWQCR
jgi:hypothetical protein